MHRGTSVIAILITVAAGDISRAQPPATAPTTQQLITLNFPENLELKVLIDYVSQRLKINILYDEQQVNQRITVKSPAQVSEESLLGVLESALKMKQLALVEGEQPGWKRIVQVANLASAAQPSTQTSDEIRAAAVTQLYPIQHVDVKLADQVIKPFLSQPGGNSVVLEDQRTLIITDFSSNLPRLSILIGMIDQPAAKQAMRFLPVANLEAGAFANQISQILTARQQSKTGEQAAVSVQILHDPRTNQLILIGPEAAVDEAQQIAISLDVPLELKTTVYRFSSVSPERIDRLTKNLIGPMDAKRLYQSTIDPEAGLLIVTATMAIHQRIESLQKELDIPITNEQSPVRLYKLANATAAEVLQTIQAIEGNQGFAQVAMEMVLAQDGHLLSPSTQSAVPSPQIPYENSGAASLPPLPGQDILQPRQTVKTDRATVTSDPNTNTIIVVADPATQQIYEQLIKLLDKRRPQVLIDCIVVTLDTSDNLSVGVEIGGSDLGLDEDPQFISFSSFGLSVVNPATGRLTMTPGTGFNGAILSSDVADVVIKALASNAKARVLSRPRILVNDNATGTLRSIAEAPFASLNASDTVASTSFGGYAEAGTDVTVTPHIGEGDFLQLDYTIALNSFTGEPTGTLPPPRQTNSINSRVTIPDGHTIVVGGLNLHSTTRSITSIPLLRKIPLLEYLVSSRSTNRAETTLFVFLRPAILRDDQFEDLKYLSQGDARAAGLSDDYPASEPLVIH